MLNHDYKFLLAASIKKRQFILALQPKDFLLKHAAADFLAKKRMYDRRKIVNIIKEK